MGAIVKESRCCVLASEEAFFNGLTLGWLAGERKKRSRCLDAFLLLRETNGDSKIHDEIYCFHVRKNYEF